MNEPSYRHGDDTAHVLADTAARFFLHLGVATRMLIEWQAQVAAMAMTGGGERYWSWMEELQRNYGASRWADAQRAQWLSALVPFEAWVDAASALQAVSAATLMDGWVAPPIAAEPRSHPAERRRHSVIIPFPDRRRHLSA